ncbi:hypothetical protein RCG18_25210 [Clostridium sp. OS1-26]|nr:hypothetical protein [Clostridium sp. OS1-26]WML34539.1 hypothetical protein RCG18_25210 [Clostridium sp. OS1-26]
MPIILANLATGGDPLYAMAGVCGFAQVGVAVAIFFKTKDNKLKALSGSAILPGALSGVTEPIIYGLLMPYRKTLFYVIIGGALGGAINGSLNVKMISFAFASFLSIPTNAPILSYCIGAAAAFITAIMLTFILGYETKEK